MLFLGIDQSLNHPGLVVIDDGGAVRVAAALKVSEKCKGAARLAALRAFYRDHLTAPIYELGALEGPSLDSTHREFDLGEASAVAKLAVYFATGSKEPVVVAPMQLKKFICGTTGATKQDVIDAVKQTYGFTTGNDNIADAFVLARIALHLHLGTYPPSRPATEVLAALRFSSAPKTPAKRASSKTRSKTGPNL